MELKHLKSFEQYNFDESEQTNELFGKKTSDEEYVKKGEEIINTHKAKKMMLDKLSKLDKEVEKEIIDENGKKVKKPVTMTWLYKRYVGKNPNIKYIGWLEKENDFVDQTVYKDATGLLGSRKI